MSGGARRKIFFSKKSTEALFFRFYSESMLIFAIQKGEKPILLTIKNNRIIIEQLSKRIDELEKQINEVK